MKSSNVRIRFEDPNLPGEIGVAFSTTGYGPVYRIDTPRGQLYDLPESGLRALAAAIAVALGEAPAPAPAPAAASSEMMRVLELAHETIRASAQPKPMSDEAMAWAHRASHVHRELASYNISCRALRSRISGLRFAAFENTYGIKAEATDGGLLSFWRVEADEGNHAGDAPSFETAAIACGEHILMLLEARAKETEAALGEKA